MSELCLPSRCTANLPDDLDQEHLIAELKLDGSRYVMYLGAGADPYERQPIHALLSRQISKVDGKHVDRTLNIPHILSSRNAGLDGTVLDGECFHTDCSTTTSIMGSGPAVAVEKQKRLGWVTFWAWDVMKFRGIDVRGRPLSERRKILEEIVARFDNEFVRAVPQVPGHEAEALFNRVTAAGKEGLVIKDLRLGYGIGWAKMKKSYEISGFISGFKPGKANGKYKGTVGSIAFSVYGDDGKPVEIGFASGMDDPLRFDMGANPDKYLGRVVDVYAQEMTKDGRCRHATFWRFRDDLNDTDATMAKVKADLAAQAKSKRKRGGE